jgi:hypothetical protein
MSLTRPDRSLGGEDYKHVSPELIESLISEKNENHKLTKKSFAKQYIKRHDESLRDNPNFHELSYLNRLLPFFNYSMTLNVLCGSEDKRGEEIDVEILESFYMHERFPDNWKKAEQTVDANQLRNGSSDIRKIVNDLDKEKKAKDTKSWNLIQQISTYDVCIGVGVGVGLWVYRWFLGSVLALVLVFLCCMFAFKNYDII